MTPVAGQSGQLALIAPSNVPGLLVLPAPSTPLQIPYIPTAGLTIPSGANSIVKVGTGNVTELPTNVQNTFQQYENTGWKGNFSGQTSGTKAGSPYQNRDGALPATDSIGNPITYREFDVNNKLPNANRDAQRFVVGTDGSVYYSDSHYGDGVSPTGIPSFIKIKE